MSVDKKIMSVDKTVCTTMYSFFLFRIDGAAFNRARKLLQQLSVTENMSV